MLPPEMGCGAGVTCWRRLRNWQEAGVWDRLASHAPGPTRRGGPHRLEPRESGQCQHSGEGGRARRPEPDGSRQDPGVPRTKRHVVGDRTGCPRAALLTVANRHDTVVFEALIDAIPPIRQPNGRRRRRPGKLHADKAYDIPRCRQALRRRHIRVRIARKGIDSSQHLGRHRWVIERTLAWLTAIAA